MLKTPIKASQITNLTDARYFAAIGVKWMGFNFDTSSFDYINPTLIAAVKEWIEGPVFVGEFGLQSAEAILEAFKMLDLDMIQLNMLTPPETIKQITGIPKMMEIIVDPSTTDSILSNQLEILKDDIDYFILNFDKNKISWKELKMESNLTMSLLQSIFTKHQALISIDLSVEELEEMLATFNPLGLSVVGGEEEKVGVKSFDDLDELFEVLEMEE